MKTVLLLAAPGAALVLIAGCATTTEPAEDVAEASETVTETPAVVDNAVNEPEMGMKSAPALADHTRLEPPFDGLVTSDDVVSLIRDHEGLRLEAYQGPSGKWLIGYGHGGDAAQPGATITEAEAEGLLRADLGVIENAIKDAVTVPINQAELSAMVDLAYNIGTGNFRNSSVLRFLNQDERAKAADAFLLWNKVTVNGVKSESPVLTERRERERAIFLGESE